MRPLDGYSILVDGYNVIKRHAPWSRLVLEDGRRRLIGLLQHARWPVPVTRIIVVFDTHDAEAGCHRMNDHVEVRFASPSADAYLQDAIRALRAPARLLVISDDREILSTAKSHHAHWRHTSWLFEHAGSGAKSSKPARDPKRSSRHEPEDDHPSAGIARSITEEMAKRWLRP